MNDKYEINISIIILSHNLYTDEPSIYTLSDTKIEIPNLFIDNNNKKNIIDNIIAHIQSLIQISEIDIDLKLISLHSNEIKEYLNLSEETICPIYSAEIPQDLKLKSGYWRKFSILDHNDGISYPISQAMQRCVL